MLEPQRTNYVPNSENMSAWNQTSLLSITGGNVGVYGSVNAYNVIPNETSTSHRIWISSLGLSSNNHTFTIYAKENGCKDLFVYCNSNGTDYARWFNLETGVMGSASGGPTSTSMTPVGNGWHKIQISGNTDLVSIEVYLGNGTESISWLPDGTQGALMQFGQLEIGSYATSYIPTSGSAVTRVLDSCNQTVPDGVIGQTEGSIYAEYYFDATIDNAGGSDRDIVSINDGTFNNIIQIVHYGNGIGNAYKSVYLNARLSSSYVVSIASSAYGSGLMKVACGYKNNDYVLYVNGVQIGTDTNAGVPSCSVINFAKITGIQTPTPINQTKLYNTRLSNAELASLTTI